VLFNYLFARKHGGSLVLRIEDTDRKRYEAGSLESILEGIRWLQLSWDEGPEVGGPFAPYFQSQRLARYQEVADILLAAGHAYRCFCTPERLDALRREQEKARQPTRYDGHCRDLDPGEVQRRLDAGEASVVRMRVPDGRTAFEDVVHGGLQFDNGTIDDQVLLKSDGFPTYHLASVVDDHDMKISHVIRGDEWLPSTPKHVMLYGMLGWDSPAFVHLPLVLGPDRAKLSKRHGADALLEFRDMGYLPEAMCNFLAFLGWSPGTGEEFFNLDGLVHAFDIEKIQASPAIFDPAKLDSVNGEHIRALPPDEFVRRLRPFVPQLPEETLAAAAPLIQTRIAKLSEAAPLLDFLVRRPESFPDGLVPKKADRATTATALKDARDFFERVEIGPDMEAELRALAAASGWKAGDLFMTLRVALTGSRVTPPLLESAALLGRQECLARLDRAIAELQGTAAP
jgi:glutamyl-tRNA synthetase